MELIKKKNYIYKQVTLGLCDLKKLNLQPVT